MCGTCDTGGGDDGAVFPGIGRRGLLRGAVGGTAAGVALGLGTGAATAAGPGPESVAAAASAGRKRRGREPGTAVSLRWLGVAGWEMAFDGHRILVDPYLTRQEYRVPGSSAIDADRALAPDSGTVEAVVSRHLTGVPELILVTHGHFDHLLDVPHLLNRPQWRDSAIRTLCGETSLHLLNGLGTEQKRLNEAIVLSGGEVLRFPAGPTAEAPAYTVEAFRSLHSQYGNHGFFAPGTLTHPPAAVRTLGDMREGGTLAYQVTVGNGPSVMFLSGTANLAERELEGARPDVLVLGISGQAAVHRYVERAMEVLGKPPVVVPSHHDDMLTSLLSPDLDASVNQGLVTALRKTVSAYGAEVLEPRHLHNLAL